MAPTPPNTDVIRVYGDSRSGNCEKVRLALDYLSRPYDWVEVDSVGGETRSPDFLRINPLGQAPCASLPGIGPLAQSNAILCAVAEGSPLLPPDAAIRAQVNQWLFWEANNHEFFVAGCISHMTYMGGTLETRDPMRVSRAERALDEMEAHLAVRDWFVADKLTVADIALFAYTRQAEIGGFSLANRPAVKAWIGRAASELGVAAA